MSYQQYSPSGFRVLPPVVKNLIIINVIMFIATIVLKQSNYIDLTDLLGLHYFEAEKFAPYQFVTYMFMHGSFTHIFFNMFALWMFGGVLEHVWGPKRFLTFYVVTGIGAALVHYLVFYYQVTPALNAMESFLAHPDIESLKQFAVNHRFMVDDSSPEIYASFNDFQQTFVALQHNPGNMEAMQQAVNFVNAYHEHFLNIPVVVGASGAIYGLLLAFGMLFPNSLIYLYFFIPMKAKWFVILFGGIELISGFYDQGSNIAHFAHLGGMIFGFLLIIYWRKKSQNHFNQWQ